MNSTLFSHLYLPFFLVIYSSCDPSFKPKIPITLDISMKMSTDAIVRVPQSKNWITFKVKNTASYRIGDVMDGAVEIMKDTEENIEERTVYVNLDKKAKAPFRVKIVSKIEFIGIRTDEYITSRNGDANYYTRLIRKPITLDIGQNNQGNLYLKITTPFNDWKQYKISEKYECENRIGDVIDGDVYIVKDDDEDANIRIRYVHKLKFGFVDKLKRKVSLPGVKRPENIVRVYTYYHEGDRSFDEFIEKIVDGNKSYTEHVRIPISLDLSNPIYSEYVTTYSVGTTRIGYRVANRYKNDMRIGSVNHGGTLIEADSPNIRLRLVFVPYDFTFEWVSIKTCYKRGECITCKYILTEGKYVKEQCTEASYQDSHDSKSSLHNIRSSTDKLGDSVIFGEWWKQPPKVEVAESVLCSTELLSYKKSEDDVARMITIDVSDTSIPDEINMDLLPRSNALYYSLKHEFIDNFDLFRIMNGGDVVVEVSLKNVVELEFTVKIDDLNVKRIFLWAHYGKIDRQSHEILLLDSLKEVAKYTKCGMTTDSHSI